MSQNDPSVEQKTEPYEDKRTYRRYEQEETILIELMASSYDGSLPRQTITCSTVNISREGLQVITATEMRANTILDLSITMQVSQKRFDLTGEVKWVRAAGSHYLVGFQLFDGDGTDIEAWHTLFSE